MRNTSNSLRPTPKGENKPASTRAFITTFKPPAANKKRKGERGRSY